MEGEGQQMPCVTVDGAYMALMNVRRSFVNRAPSVLLIFSLSAAAAAAAPHSAAASASCMTTNMVVAAGDAYTARRSQ